MININVPPHAVFHPALLQAWALEKRVVVIESIKDFMKKIVTCLTAAPGIEQ